MSGAVAWVGTNDRAGSATATAGSPAAVAVDIPVTRAPIAEQPSTTTPVRQDPPRQPVGSGAAAKNATDNGTPAIAVDQKKRRFAPVKQNKRRAESVDQHKDRFALVDQNKRRTESVDQNKRRGEPVDRNKRRAESVDRTRGWVPSRLAFGRSFGHACKAVDQGRTARAICRVTETAAGKNHQPRVQDVRDQVVHVRPTHLKEQSLKDRAPIQWCHDRVRPAYPRSVWQARPGGPGARPNLDGSRLVRAGGPGAGDGAFGG
ncbi:hypothetical protein AB0B57_07170 [Micromonospora sp. NPDC049101]|uniref:hypothetical protein n=1 Tax=Micromonospora sp. NPDC049101 TaxID=3155032 RepID=UPI0033D367FB